MGLASWTSALFFLALKSVRLTYLFVVQHPNEYFASSDSDKIWDLSVRPRFKPHEAFTRVHAFVEASLDLPDGNAEGGDQHSDGGVGDVVRYAGQADDYRVVSDVDDLDGDASDVEPIGAQVIEAVFSAKANVDIATHQSDALQLAQFVVKLLFQLVNDLRHRHVRQDGVVLRVEHHRIGFQRVESDNVAAVALISVCARASSSVSAAGHRTTSVEACPAAQPGR